MKENSWSGSIYTNKAKSIPEENSWSGNLEIIIVDKEEELLQMAVKVLKKLILEYGFVVNRNNDLSFQNVNGKEWYNRMGEFVRLCYKNKECYEISKKMGFGLSGEGRVYDWKYRLRETIMVLTLSKEVSRKDKKIIQKILPYIGMPKFIKILSKGLKNLKKA